MKTKDPLACCLPLTGSPEFPHLEVFYTLMDWDVGMAQFCFLSASLFICILSVVASSF